MFTLWIFLICVVVNNYNSLLLTLFTLSFAGNESKKFNNDIGRDSDIYSQTDSHTSDTEMIALAVPTAESLLDLIVNKDLLLRVMKYCGIHNDGS